MSDRAADLSFSKARRLRGPAQFARVKAEGQAQRGSLMVLGFLHVDGIGLPCAGFVTSKRVGGAVVRNRIRRRLREIVRLHQHQLRDDFWIVTIARPAAAKASYHALEQEWLRLTKRASILAP